VTITGSGFSGVTKVAFGSTVASNVTVNSETSITVVSPSSVSETVDVRVTAKGGTSAVNSKDRFKYGKPTVSGVSQSSGPLAGGTKVTITGSGFALGSGTVFEFGKVPASSVNCTSTTSCTATSPVAAKTGAVDVIAAIGKAKSKKSPPADQFTYL
jgi:hypothetical protein